MSKTPAHFLFSTLSITLLLVSACSSSSSNAPDNSITQSDILDSSDDGITLAPPLQIDTSNFEQLATQAVEAINLVSLDEERAQASTLLQAIDASGLEVLDGGETFPGLTLMSQTPVVVDETVADFTQSYSCDNGGLLQFDRGFFNQPASSVQIIFDNCDLNGELYNGRIESFSERRSNGTTTFGDYSRTTVDDVSISITGNLIEPFSSGIGLDEDIIWENTTFSISDATRSLRISNLNWRRQGVDSILPDFNSVIDEGSVLLADGTTAFVANRFYTARLEASFELFTALTQFEGVQVNVDLDYSSSYFDWTGSDSEENDFMAPAFPITDLGDTIELSSTADFSDQSTRIVELMPRDPSPQWQTGSIRIADLNNGELVIQPDPEQIQNVQIELNSSGELITRRWADGFQVNCPSVVVGCGSLENE